MFKIPNADDIKKMSEAVQKFCDNTQMALTQIIKNQHVINNRIKNIEAHLGVTFHNPDASSLSILKTISENAKAEYTEDIKLNGTSNGN
jgi:hypothetical protein